MRIRTLLAVAAVPALVVALAAPGHAVSRGVVAFEGSITVRPTSVPQQQVLDICFFTLGDCLNDAGSTGFAAGAGSAALDPAIDGLQARATYTEACDVAGVPVVGSAALTANLHKTVTGDWTGDLSASWTRAGLVAVIQGDAIGTALFTPVGVPACDRPVPVAVAGAVEVAY